MAEIRVPFFSLNYDEREEQALLDTLRSKWISMGPRVEEFERQFSKRHGVAHGVAVANCTAALHLALRGLDIGAGDEVIVPSLTFVATAAAVLAAGARPVFADVCSLDDWTIDPESVRAAITDQTKAIVPMHYGGFGADMPVLCTIADEHGLKLIEDACHAPLGKLGDRSLGSFGDVACYSFYSNKNLSTGEGGMIITDDEGLAVRLRQLRSHGMTTSAHDREQGKEFYNVLEFGYNYRMDDMHAALGLVQLEKQAVELEQRRQVYARYLDKFRDTPEVHVPFQDYEGAPAYHVFGVLVPGRRKEIAKRLLEAGVQNSMHYPPVHQFECFRPYSNGPLPITEEVGQRGISLPMHGRISADDIDFVCETLTKVIQEVQV